MEPSWDSLKVLGGALVALAVQWIHARGIPLLREKIAAKKGAPSSSAPPPLLPHSSGQAPEGALILEKLRAQEVGETIERARLANIEVYQREIRMLGTKIDELGVKVDALAKSKTLSLQELQRAAARFKRLLDDLEGVRDAIAETLKRPL